MNHFAHLFLAQPTIESTVGNLLGDFARGVDISLLRPAVKAGLMNHRHVDRFTDSHPVVIELKTRFSEKRRRFSGIALDIYFDHLLMKFWLEFDTRDLQQVIDECYSRMIEGEALMPNQNMREITRRMVDYDWFGSYQHAESIAQTLDRVASRIRFANEFDRAIEDIEKNSSVIEAGFLEFFPQLCHEIEHLGLEIQ